MRRVHVVGALVVLLAPGLFLATGVPPSTAQEPVPAPGGVYSGRLIDATGECSRGSFTLGEEFSLVIAEYGATIQSIGVTGLTLLPLLSGPTSYNVPTAIPVAPDGSFDHDFSPGGLAQVHFEGRFQGTSVSGSFRVDAADEVCEGTFQAELVPVVRQETTFEGPLPLVDGCGGGSFFVARAADLLSITRISIEGFVANGQTFSGSATFDEGTVPISPDTGAFDWVYFPGREPGQEIAMSGRFFQGNIRGWVTASPSTCGPVDLDESLSLPSICRGGAGLPAVGTGPAAGSGAAVRWEHIAVALGLLALGAAFATARLRAK